MEDQLPYSDTRLCGRDRASELEHPEGGLEEGEPLLGVYIHQNDQVAPPEMTGQKKIAGNRDALKTFVNGL